MAGKSKFLEEAMLNWLKGTSFPTAPTAIYAALYNGDPTDLGTGGTEVTSTIRTAGRVPVTLGPVSNSAVANSAVVDFGAAAAATTITHFALFSAATGGNLLYSAPLSGGTQTINQNNPVSFAVNSLSFSEG